MTLPLEKQVVSLEPAQKMKELGFRQESLYRWVEFAGVEEPNFFRIELSVSDKADYTDPEESAWSAYTVAELGEMLKETMGEIPTNIFRQTIWMNGKWWGTMDTDNSTPSISADTEADARAKMLIYLKENKLITP